MGTEYGASIQIRDKTGRPRTNRWRNAALFNLEKDVFAWSNNASVRALDLESAHGYDLAFCMDYNPDQCMGSTCEMQPANLSPEISSFPYQALLMTAKLFETEYDVMVLIWIYV